MATTVDSSGVIRSRVHSRIGLLGNPSDGFGGACISLSLANFYAEVTLTPDLSGALRFVPHPQHDPLRFAGPAAFMAHAGGAGLHGGVPLLQAACLALLRHCEAAGLALAPDAAGWALAYETNIPRQRGLSGSSAIVIAALNCLLRHYGLEAAVPPAQRPRLALEAEALLGITAGLQDRVIQVYGGLVAMDFDERRVAREGRGRYRSLDPALLPPLWLLYRAGAPPGKHSGAVHSSVRRRWLEGDFDVREGMRQVATLAAAGRRALQGRDCRHLAALMRGNLRLRRHLYGDAVVGADSLEMAEVAASVGAAAKLTGSGGAVVALCPEGDAQAAALREACRQRGLECVAVQVGPQLHAATDELP